MRLLAALLSLLCLAGAAPAGQAQPVTVVVLETAALADDQGNGLGQARALLALPLLETRAGRLKVAPAPGQEAWLEAGAAALVPGPPQAHHERLARLRAAPLEPELARRLAAGRIQAGDSQWLVELAWGRPWRSSMVNRFQDEEHYVYQGAAGSLLLRFKGGRLIPPLPAQLESPSPPR